MAAASKSTKASPLGVSAGPESVVLVESTNIDVDSNIDFFVLGPCEAIELTIVSGAAKTGTPSVVFTLQRVSDLTGTVFDLVASSAMTDTGTPLYLATSHHSAAVANKVAQRIVSGHMRLKIDYTGTPVTDVLNAVTVVVDAI